MITRPEVLQRNHLIATGLLVFVTLAGIAGLTFSASKPLFQALTPLYLLLHVIVLFSFHNSFIRSFWAFSILTFLVGYFVELVGVHTGMPFGEYDYLNNLGPKLFQVPVLIGVNWLLLIYCCGIITDKISASKLFKALAGSCLMLLVDVLMEPVAIDLHLWRWQDSHVPVQNYGAWFVISFLLLLVFHYAAFEKQNRMAPVVLGVLLGFFAALNIL